MKLHLVAVALQAALGNARVVAPSSDTRLEKLGRDLEFSITHADDLVHWNEPSTAGTNADPPSSFNKFIGIGRTLDAAMKAKDSIARWFFKDFPNFAETCQSPFDGDGREELRKWGYDDSDELRQKVANECDFDKYHGIKAAFDELGLDTHAEKDGGPNKCFRVDHRNGPAIKRNEDGSLPSEENQYYDVCGTTYRATAGTFEFSVNPNGMVALMNIMSLSFTAEKYTWMRKPLPSELPHIGAAQEIAWAMWNRAGAADIKDVKYLLVTQVINAGTRDAFRSALQTLNPPQSEKKTWPGHDFAMDTTGGLAILGSPVGRWAAYFLVQHKEQLGGNRFISKVRIWKPDNSFLPYMVFYVNPTPATADAASQGLQALEHGLRVTRRIGDGFSSRVIKKSADGRHVVREHVMY